MEISERILMKVIVYQNMRNEVKVYEASTQEAEGNAYLYILKDMRDVDAFEGWDTDDPSMYEEAVRCVEENDWGAARIPVKYLFRYYAQYPNVWYKFVDLQRNPFIVVAEAFDSWYGKKQKEGSHGLRNQTCHCYSA